ncbi:hypothetical protein L0F81_17220 [Streptomyces tricolor]|uniref:Uncharacterized protein n=1 Tax=Streptomyces tricolor TaxID=68277 RepID=A0ABS9JHH4_9ACTN|nr:hypothetical protein [Streptomyces tricolor]MCG0065015.1 hypothetical protein [Streptomyces tricolor]
MNDEEFQELRAHVRQAILTAYDLPKELTDAWAANHPVSAGPVRPDEEPT